MKYPVPVFHFQVTVSGVAAEFAEVSGLTMERQKISYRHGLLKDAPEMVMPGIPKYSHVTLKRGMTKGNGEFYNWLNKAALNVPDRREVTISLLDEEHNPILTWKVKDAWPVKFDGPGLKATGNEVSIESLELAHEGITFEAN